VELRWTAPADLDGGVITDYAIQYKASNASSWSTFSHTASVVTAATVTGLTAATSYDFRVAAVAADGTSEYSTPLTASTLSGVTSVPRSLVAGTATTTSVALSWAAPESLNGGVIIDYRIEYTSAGANSGGFVRTASSSTVATVTGLTAGTMYQFQVAAVATDGTSAYSTSVTKATLTALSGITSVPRTLTARTTTATSVALRWTIPASLNGGVISDYLIQYRKAGTTRWLTFAHTASTATTRTVTGLLSRTNYQFQVAARTTAGTSPWASATKTTLAR
jgi:chitodextrinase